MKRQKKNKHRDIQMGRQTYDQMVGQRDKQMNGKTLKQTGR
jgi:hypothetical protein